MVVGIMIIQADNNYIIKWLKNLEKHEGLHPGKIGVAHTSGFQPMNF